MSYFFAESGPQITGTPATMEGFEVGDKVNMVADDDDLALEIIAIARYGFVPPSSPRNTGRPGAIQAVCLIKKGIMKGSNGGALAVPGHLLYLEKHQMVKL